MFVESCAIAPMPFPAARAAFEIAVGAGLTVESRRAAIAAADVAGAAFGGLHEQIHVQVLSVRSSARNITVAVRWDTCGLPRSCPGLDADLALSQRGGDDSGLSIVACYRPPLTGSGAGCDRDVTAKAAQKTVDAFLAAIVARLNTIHATTAQLPRNPPGARPRAIR